LKKSIVALLIALALVILVSPGIIGRLAERSLEHDLDIVESGNQGIRITPQGFDRGWFSSEGRHRIELRQGRLTRIFGALTGSEPTELPVLIVDTHLDHGLIPLGSMSREHGALTPGLGRAVSTIRLEAPDGTTTDLPGTVYSTLSLGGELKSSYVLPAGSVAGDDTSTAWGNVDMTLTLHPGGGSGAFDATVDAASFTRDGNAVNVGKLVFSGSTSRGSDGRLGGRSTLDVAAVPLAGMAPGDLHVSIRFDGIDVAVFDDVVRDLERAATSGMPPKDDAALRRFVASGFEFAVKHFDVDTTDGTLSSALHLHLNPMDAGSFAWPSALLALDASAELRIPAKLFERAAAQEPDLNAIAGLGYLRREGDFYELHAAFKKGVLTVNDAPIPIPLQEIR
jgi:hypothetical protein